MSNHFQRFLSLLRSSKKTIVLIVVVALVTTTISTTVSIMLSKYHNLTLPSIGTIKTVGTATYWDPNGENQLTEINWGVIELNSSKDFTIYVKSTSNFRTFLNVYASDWSPVGISEYVALSWNYSGVQLDSGEIIPVKFTLTTSYSDEFINYLIANSVDEFNFAIHIVASE